MTDLELLSLLVFLYENRASTAPTSDDMQQSSDLLQKGGHINLDVDTCQAVNIDVESTDSLDVVIAFINEYQPVPPLNLHADKSANVDSISKLRTRGMSRHTYTKNFPGPMPFPRLHGGEVVCEGDVQVQTIIDSVAVSDYDALMTSFCVCKGTITDCTEQSLDELCGVLRRRVQLSSDDSTFGFLLDGASDHTLKYTRTDYVRSWQIVCEASRGRLTLQVMHSLR